MKLVLPRKQQAKFGPKTVSCIYLGFDDNALSFILGKLPNFGIVHSAHAVFNDDDFPCRRSTAVWREDAL